MEESTNTSSQQQYYSPGTSNNRKSSKRFILFFVVFVLLAIAGTTLFFLMKGSGKNTEEKITPTPTQFQFPTETPAPSVSPTEQVSPTKASVTSTPSPTPRPTSNPIDKTSGLDRSKISVSVLNGSGTGGAGKKAADLLTSLGYKVSGTGNADNYDYEKTVIDIKSSSSKYLDLLKKDLGGAYSIGSTSASFTGASDAQIIVGRQ